MVTIKSILSLRFAKHGVFMIAPFIPRVACFRGTYVGMLDSVFASSKSFRTSQFQNSKSDSRRWLGSKATAGNPPGEIYIEDNQDWLKVDHDRLKSTIARIRSALGYATYDVSVFLVDDREMRKTNRKTRSVDAPTDVLSFPFHPAIQPGKLQEPDFDIPDYYNLGDVIVDTQYVIRRCAADMEALDERGLDDRGVSGAMSTTADPEERIHMLLIHGLLHLLGHDHEKEDEYELMVSAEETLLQDLGMVKRHDRGKQTEK